MDAAGFRGQSQYVLRGRTGRSCALGCLVPHAQSFGHKLWKKWRPWGGRRHRRRPRNSAANANMRKSNTSTLESGRQCSPQFSIFQLRALYFTRVNWSNLCKHYCKVFRRWRPRASAGKASTYCVGALVVVAHFRGLAGRTSMFSPQAWRWPKPSGQ